MIIFTMNRLIGVGQVKNLTISRLCERRVITAVNGSLPGPTLKVSEGDTVVIHVINDSPYDITIHWYMYI